MACPLHTMRSTGWDMPSLLSPAADGEDVVAALMASSLLACREFHRPAGTRPEA